MQCFLMINVDEGIQKIMHDSMSFFHTYLLNVKIVRMYLKYEGTERQQQDGLVIRAFD